MSVERGVSRDCKVLLSHPTGNANVRQALLAFSEREMLAGFYTTLSWKGSAWSRLLPAGGAREFERRSYQQIPERLIHTAPLREFCRILLRKAGANILIDSPGSPFSVPGVYRDADRRVARSLARAGCTAVYAYDGGALETFRAARREGIRTIYELPTAHTRFKVEFFREEAQLQPEFAATLATVNVDLAWLDRKDEELALADRVIVPSSYVQSTLPAHVPQDRVRVIAYGAPAVADGQSQPKSRERGKLRVLFVGNLSQGKGLSYLLEAIRSVGSAVEFTMIGTRVASCKPLDDALRQYRWLGSVPHAVVLEEMARHDVLAFPTLSEGLALVILEAMSRGMAVVTTPNSGVVGILRDGVDGFMIPIRSCEALAQKLELLAGDRDRLQAMSESARLRAQEYSWERYRELLSTAVQQVEVDGMRVGPREVPQ